MPSPVRCLVVLPPSYATSPERRYPVLYFLHDGWGNGRTLEQRGVAEEARQRMADGRLPEFLIVAPGRAGQLVLGLLTTATAASSSSSSRTCRRWVESHHRGIPAQSARGITGISMGGYGSVKTALRHPRALRLGVVPLRGAHSDRLEGSRALQLDHAIHPEAGLRDGRAEQFSRRERRRGSCSGDSASRSRPFVVHMRGGTEDFYGLERVAVQYGMLLNERGVPTTVVLEPGTHDWRYWRTAMIDILAWHAARFEYDPR